MQTLLIMRHAKSSWKNPSLTDHDRPLNKRGKRAAPKMAEHLRKNNLFPDFIIGSTAVRVVQTAALLAGKAKVRSEFVADLYHAEPDAILKILSSLPDTPKIPMLIGHNPGLEDLLEHWAKPLRLPTAAVCVLHLDLKSWQDIKPSTNANLLELWCPKDLGIF